MASTDEIALDIPNFMRVYKDGRIERLTGTDVVPPSLDPTTGVSSKDIDIIPELGVSVRLYLPKLTATSTKLPVLVYYHGGGFVIESPFSPTYHNYLNSLVAEANVIAVSVHYRRAPEHFLPAAYDDSWAALQWTVSHADGGPEAWLRDHGDFTRVFVAGDSAGGNIVHDMVMRAGSCELGHGVKIYGAILIHPFFWGEEAIGNEMKNPAAKGIIDAIWKYVCPSTVGLDDPLINPISGMAPSLSRLGCGRVIVCVAEKDSLKDRGWVYYHTLASSGWEGTVEILETEGEDHVFHMFNPGSEKAVEMLKRLAAFLNR
ncbi:probable carboxylesterase 12 [Magnolia sinica]|uniref:probable carboxylesterase 12 n=1 Tax=Magnolia sinica TaxID=86752 RepID=UPI00265AACDD|nr:probable carboxylesterase 12 [Magnolia sinica]